MLVHDVLENVFKRLPIETRLALGVKPNKVAPASTAVIDTVTRMAKAVSHPHQLRWVTARMEGEDKPVKIVSFMDAGFDADGTPCGDAYYYMSACRTKRVPLCTHFFTPFPDPAWRMFPAFDWEIARIKEYEQMGAII